MEKVYVRSGECHNKTSSPKVNLSIFGRSRACNYVVYAVQTGRNGNISKILCCKFKKDWINSIEKSGYIDFFRHSRAANSVVSC